MNTNQLMTAAAVGLAVFAVYKLTAKPGGSLMPTNAGERQRMADLQAHINAADGLWGSVTPSLTFSTSYMNYLRTQP